MLMIAPDRDLERLDPLTRGEIDGLICAGTPDLVKHVRSLRQRAGFGDRPMLSLIHGSPGVPSVLCDYAVGVREATAHLLSLGHRHFLRISSGELNGPDRSLRRVAMNEAIAAAGLDVDQHAASIGSPWAWMNPIEAMARLPVTDREHPGDRELIQYLRAHPQITAIICNNDPMAIHVSCALRDAGIDVPGRYSVVGFDDSDPIHNSLSQNTLSSIRVPLVAIGRRGADIVLDAIEHEDQELISDTLPSTFIARASVGPPGQTA
jgi:LacI family transcriptional regulator